MPLVYDELRRVARRYMRSERPGHSLQATAIVHEAYLRLLKDTQLTWQNEGHFRAIAAASMRQVLVDSARARAASKRGGSRVRVTLNEDDAVAADGNRNLDLLTIDDALGRLAALDPQQARIVELRFFGGLTIGETAEAVGISPASVKRAWTVAKAWLKREVGAPAAAHDTHELNR
jgi:RNA polymerase sigma factor (TIGR02999 family)